MLLAMVIAVTTWALLLGLVSSAHGHMPGKSFVIYELPDERLDEVDLHDGSIGEWEALMGAPSLRARPDWADSAGHYTTATREVPYGVSDGDCECGWHGIGPPRESTSPWSAAMTSAHHPHDGS